MCKKEDEIFHFSWTITSTLQKKILTRKMIIMKAQSLDYSERLLCPWWHLLYLFWAHIDWAFNSLPVEGIRREIMYAKYKGEILLSLWAMTVWGPKNEKWDWKNGSRAISNFNRPRLQRWNIPSKFISPMNILKHRISVIFSMI